MKSEQKPSAPAPSNPIDGETPVANGIDAESKSGGSVFKRLKRWLIRYGPIGVFLFFLIKGLIWVAVAVLAWWGLRGG